MIHDLDYLYHATDEGVAARLRELSSGWRALEELKGGGLIRGIGAGIDSWTVYELLRRKLIPGKQIVPCAPWQIPVEALDSLGVRQRALTRR